MGDLNLKTDVSDREVGNNGLCRLRLHTLMRVYPAEAYRKTASFTGKCGSVLLVFMYSLFFYMEFVTTKSQGWKFKM